MIEKYITEKKNSDASERDIVDHLPETLESALAEAKLWSHIQFAVKVSGAATTIIGGIVIVQDTAGSSRRSLVR